MFLLIYLNWIIVVISMKYYGLVLTGGFYHDLERYHDFAVEINYFLNTRFLLQNHDNGLNHDNSLQ